MCRLQPKLCLISPRKKLRAEPHFLGGEQSSTTCKFKKSRKYLKRLVKGCEMCRVDSHINSSDNFLTLDVRVIIGIEHYQLFSHYRWSIFSLKWKIVTSKGQHNNSSGTLRKSAPWQNFSHHIVCNLLSRISNSALNERTGINPKKLDIRSLPFSGNNRRWGSCNSQKSPLG